ncbi:MAG TPA: mechanosensitive ion channel family protein [bacterium]|nr:mechanosensitive ion channel family protein [bacterium]
MEDLFTRCRRALSFLILLCLMPLAAPSPSFADEPAPADTAALEKEAAEISAPVTIDGVVLFRVRGIRSYPAERRAKEIRNRIVELAKDPTVRSDTLTVAETNEGTEILAGARRVMTVLDADAGLEGLNRQVVAHAFALKMGEAVERYRRDRSPENLRRGAIRAALATAAFLAALFLALWILRRIARGVERRYKARTRDLKVGSFDVVHAGRVWTMIQGAVNAVRVAVVLVLLYVYLEFTLSLFPWTHAFAEHLLDLVVNPLASMSQAVVDYLPSLAFLIILIVVTRYLLKMVRYFFLRIEYGRLTLEGFEPEWARSTYKLVRGLIIVFAVVVAYPYVPGSGSEAFKGVSIFIGLIVSLGSSSAISNVIAGYTMVYRRAFKVGDVIQVESVFGVVTEMRLLATHVRTIKNEVVIVPNSLILGSNVLNYTRLAKTNGLILHSIVGIGYEASWRQVEAMLLLAADRTPGFKKDPPPFVLQKSLDDFAVKYEINAYCDDPLQIARLYTELHRNILDQFNEHGVQIMTPAYESDPAAPKVVPKDQWYAAPASPPPNEPKKS